MTHDTPDETESTAGAHDVVTQTNIQVDKYTFIQVGGHRTMLRGGAPWRDGDIGNAEAAAFYEVDRLRSEGANNRNAILEQAAIVADAEWHLGETLSRSATDDDDVSQASGRIISAHRIRKTIRALKDQPQPEQTEPVEPYTIECTDCHGSGMMVVSSGKGGIEDVGCGRCGRVGRIEGTPPPEPSEPDVDDRAHRNENPCTLCRADNIVCVLRNDIWMCGRCRKLADAWDEDAVSPAHAAVEVRAAVARDIETGELAITSDPRVEICGHVTLRGKFEIWPKPQTIGDGD